MCVEFSNYVTFELGVSSLSPLVLPLCSRDVHRTLTEERQSVAQTRKYLKEQQRGLKRRRTALRQAHREWSDDMKTFTGRHVRVQQTLEFQPVRSVCVCVCVCD